MRKRDLRDRAREQARVPLAVQWTCEACGDEWLEQSRRTTPLRAKCPACGRRKGPRTDLHDMEDDDGQAEGSA